MNIEELKKRASAGDAEAQCALGSCYENGDGVERNYRVALEYFLSAAEQGYAPAQRNAAIMYYTGKKIGKDKQKCLFWALKAAEQNDVIACRVLSDVNNWVEWREKACQLGDIDSKTALGRYYLENDEVEKGITMLEGVIKQTNGKGKYFLDACYGLGFYYLRMKNSEKAEEYFKEFSTCCGTCFEIGREYFHNGDYSKADEWFERSVALEKTQIGYIINLYAYLAPRKDHLLYWVKKVEQFAETGDSYFQEQIGDCYYNGTGVRKNKKKAIKWWRLAAEQGEWSAIQSLELIAEKANNKND